MFDIGYIGAVISCNNLDFKDKNEIIAMKKDFIIMFIIAVAVFYIFQKFAFKQQQPSEAYKKSIAEKEINGWLERHKVYNKTISFIDKEEPNHANVEYYNYSIGSRNDSLILSFGFNEGYIESGYVEIVPNEKLKKTLSK